MDFSSFLSNLRDPLKDSIVSISEEVKLISFVHT